MKPGTNFKLTVGIILLLVCGATLYFVVNGLSGKRDAVSDPDYGNNVLEK